MVSERPVILTQAGKDELEEELRQLRSVKLPAVTARIQELTSDGDVSDNSEYEDTKEDRIMIEARMREVENVLRRAQVMVPTDSKGVVQLGSSVVLVDGTGETDSWKLVSPEEANTMQGKISTDSPVGAALLGKRIGDEVVVRAPGGETKYTIREVN